MVAKNRRRFTRIITNQFAKLIFENQQISVELKDISFKGVLVAINETEKVNISIGQSIQFYWVLSDDFPAIMIESQVRWQQEDLIGLEFYVMQLSTAEQLHRYLELNLGSEELFHRELAQLLEKS